MPADRRLLLAIAVLPFSGCYASNVVATTERSVREQAEPTEWRPAVVADLVGYHRAVAIRGDAALSLRTVYYLFQADGVYTGAALVDGERGLEFQTLRGRWELGADGLVLDGAPAVGASAAPGWLRIAAPNGELLLRREELR